jgi:hypothetical protein
MASSGMLRRVALLRTDVSEELTRATPRNIPEDVILLTTTVVCSSETSVLTTATRRRMLEEGILQHQVIQTRCHAGPQTYSALGRPLLCYCASGFCLCLLIDKTNLNEQTQANIFASYSRDVARLVVIERILLRGLFVSYQRLCPFNHGSMRRSDIADKPGNLTKEILLASICKKRQIINCTQTAELLKKETHSEESYWS